MFAAEDETEAERAERLRKELPWYRGVTWKDIKDIMPTGTMPKQNRNIFESWTKEPSIYDVCTEGRGGGWAIRR